MGFHEDALQVAQRFHAQLGRHFYVTPTSYLELLVSYRTLLSKRQDEVGCLVLLITYCRLPCKRQCMVGMYVRGNPVACTHASHHQVMTAKLRYEAGLSKLEATEASVSRMQVRADPRLAIWLQHQYASVLGVAGEGQVHPCLPITHPVSARSPFAGRTDCPAATAGAVYN